MKNRYSFTPQALQALDLAGIGPEEVWEALHSGQRMIRHLPDGGTTICAVTGHGRYLMVLVEESEHEAGDWDIVAARDMQADEIDVFDRYIRRQP